MKGRGDTIASGPFLLFTVLYSLPTMTGRTIQQLLIPPYDALLQQHLADRLRYIAGRRPTDATRAEVELALTLRWWGGRERAIATLGKWGTKRDRVWLTERARRPLPTYNKTFNFGKGSPERWEYVETLACRQAVAPLLDSKDTSWLLDLFFGGLTTFVGLHSALARVTPETVLERIDKAVKQGDDGQIVAAMCLFANTPQIVTREQHLVHYTQSTNPHIARWASAMLWNLRHRGPMARAATRASIA